MNTFFVACHEVATFGAEYYKLSQRCGLETLISELVFKRAFRKCILLTPCSHFSLQKTVEKVSPILITLTSRSDSDFERSNVSFKENKLDGFNPNSNDIDYYVRKNEEKILWFSGN